MKCFFQVFAVAWAVFGSIFLVSIPLLYGVGCEYLPAYISDDSVGFSLALAGFIDVVTTIIFLSHAFDEGKK